MFQKLTQKIAVSLVLLLTPFQALFAQEPEPQPIFTGGTNPEATGISGIGEALKGSQVVSTGSVRDLVIRYVNFALPLLTLAAFVGFVYAGFLYVTAYGNEDQTEKAKKVMIYAVIGLVLVILSFSIVQLFAQGLAQGIQN